MKSKWLVFTNAYIFFGTSLYAAWTNTSKEIAYESFDGSVWSSQAVQPQARTTQGPGLAAWKHALYMGWDQRTTGKIAYSHM